MVVDFESERAVEYALKYSLNGNNEYYDFTNIGGDCTNFVSQCVYASSGVMNYTKTFGWYYSSVGLRSPAWTGVDEFYNFIVNNAKNGGIGNGNGPFGKVVDVTNSKLGDVVQLANNGNYFHSAIIVGFNGNEPLVCARTYNVRNYPLFNYSFDSLRCIRILGIRK